VLFEPGEAIESVHFPLDGVISLVTPLADGNVEVPPLGNERIALPDLTSVSPIHWRDSNMPSAPDHLP
jgi:hypothetical protein